MGGAIILTGCFAIGFFGDCTLAQITPDTTLDTQRSVVTPLNPQVDRIDGGAIRGANLFHSFQEFNVGNGRSAYFGNPTGIENILSRVTGTNPSNIFGKLGVLGNANLFLINPNGIIFGAAAQLDIRGSFFASTASSFKFPDGSEFSATKPTSPPLLTVHVTPGLQWGASLPGATIINTGNLVVGRDLTLFADKLDLQGQLQAGRDLMLLAQHTVRVRDSVTNPFLAQAGGNLTIVGNQGIDILALVHPMQTPFVSRGNLSLISDGIIFGAAAQLDIRGSFFASTASSFKFPDGSEFSATKPTAPPLLTVNVTPGLQWGASSPGATITNTGNLAVGQDLTLFADKLNLQGQLQAGRDLTLLAQDTVQVRDSVVTPFLVQAGGNLTIVGNQGIDILALLHPMQTPFVSGGNLSLVSDGIISLDARFRSGASFSIRSVSGGLANMVSEYDPIISAYGDVDVAANYTGTSLSVEATGNIRFGGNITITRPDTSTLPAGPDTATLSSRSALILRSGQRTLAYGGVNSGAVPAYGTGGVPAGITIGGTVIVQPFNGAGGTVSLSAASGNVNTRLISTNGQQIDDPYPSNVNANGGAISLIAANGSINTGDLYSYSYSRSGNGGNGGAISLTANGSINTGYLNSSSGYLNSSSDSGFGNGGNGGAISLTANGSINTGNLDSDSFSSSGNAGQGGAISLTANGINITGDLSSRSSSSSGSGGQGGNISLEAANGTITFNRLNPLYDGGSRDIDASGASGGNITLTSSAGLFELKKGSINSNASNGNGGNIQINAASVSLTNTELTTTARGTGNAGNISITADDLVKLDKSRLFTSLELGGIGRGGDITIEAGAVSLRSASFIDTATFGEGNAGNVSLKVDDSVLLDNNSAIFSITSGQGNGGNVRVEAGGAVSLANRSNISTAVNSGAVGDGGNIDIVARSLSLTGGSQLVTSTSSSGKAGNITVNTTEGVIISGVDPNFSSTQPRNVSVANPPPLAEVEPNDSIAQAQPLTQFFLNSPNDVNPNVELSTRIPYVSISGQTSGQLYIWPVSREDYYSFEVTAAGTRAIFDIDTPQPGLASALILFDRAGNQLSGNDSASPSLGAGGSTVNDPYLRYVFSEPGTYFIQVRRFSKGAYTLQISLDTPNVATSVVNGTLPSGLFARTQGAGAAGNVTINTPQLTVRDGAKVTVSSIGTGDAGNLNVTANSILLDNGQLIAETTSGEGGNIYLKVEDLLLMRNRSLISAQAGNNGNGGNIDIDARLIVAVKREDSDIVADADRGNGGNINITTQGIFGLKYRQERTPESDITASSRFGIAGTVNINQLTIDPSQGLTNLPTEVVDASNQIDQTCAAGRGEVGKNQFTITGRGGMPTSPYEMLGEEEALEDVHPPAGFSSSRNSLPVAERAVTPQRAISNPKPPIVEASGWVINDKGQVVLTATPTTVTPHDSWLPQASCPRS